MSPGQGLCREGGVCRSSRGHLEGPQGQGFVQTGSSSQREPPALHCAGYAFPQSAHVSSSQHTSCPGATNKQVAPRKASDPYTASLWQRGPHRNPSRKEDQKIKPLQCWAMTCPSWWRRGQSLQMGAQEVARALRVLPQQSERSQPNAVWSIE